MDIEALRAETPGTQNVLHFNNAGAALMADPVFGAVAHHLSLERRIGGYETMVENAAGLIAFYDHLAALFGAEPTEIAFMESATRGWVTGVYGLGLSEGDRVLTHESEYASNFLGFLQLKQRFGIDIDVVGCDSTGAIDLEALVKAITPRSKVIALTHVPTQGGLVNPAAEVGKIAREHGLIYVLDACQSAGQMPLDVAELGCDIMTGTGRKWLRGPRGTGFLYVHKGFLDKVDPPMIDLVSAHWTGVDSFEYAEGARRFEAFENHAAGKVGLGVAASEAMRLGLSEIEARVNALAASLREKLTEIGCTVADLGAQKCGIVTFTHPRLSSGELFASLRVQDINISVSNFQSARLDFERRGIAELARASTHYYNTEDEIDRFVEAIKEL